ncbi:hypothetical protein ACP70R_017741 [Stipagrostis hirtigluma subsp. patula]
MLCPRLKPCNGSSTTLLLLSLPSRLALGRPRRRQVLRRVSSEYRSEAPSSGGDAAYSAVVERASNGAAVRVTAVATVKVTLSGFLSSLRPSRAIDDVKDIIGRSLYLELASCELGAGTNYT